MARRVAVIGGGLTGLATAWRLRERHDVTLLEASDRLGGQINTVEFDGVSLDVGAEAFIARQPYMLQLARELGFGQQLVHPALSRVAIHVQGRLRPLPDATVLGAPASLRALAASGVLSPTALLRAGVEPLLPRREYHRDMSVADLVGRRFGRAVVDTLVEPMLGGVYAGRADRLSAQAAAKPIWDAARKHRSLKAGLAEHRAQSADDDRPVFATVEGGLSQLVAKVGADLSTRVHTGTAATSITSVGGVWQVETRDDRLVVDDVVVALPAQAAANVLGEFATEVAATLTQLRTVSVGVVALSYDRADVSAVPPISGVLVPRSARRLVKAVTVSANKWAHLGAADRFVLRASIGRDQVGGLAQQWRDLPDEELARRVDAEVRDLLQIDAPARTRQVVRWDDALTQYDVGHLDRVETISSMVAARPGLHVGSAALTGLGLASRAAEAERIAAAIETKPEPQT